MSAKCGGHRVERGAHRGFVADVEDGGMHAIGAEFVDQCLQAIRASAGGDDVPAACDEALRGGGAEAGGRAGDEGGLRGVVDRFHQR